VVLRDGFEAKLWGEAWEQDLEHDENLVGDVPRAKKLFRALVPDQGAKVGYYFILLSYIDYNFYLFLQHPPLPPINNPTPEQAFLAKNFDENSKKPNQDPRNVFRNPTENAGAGIVGPLGSSSFNLPNVERALTEMETGIGGGDPAAGTNLGANPVVTTAADRRLSRGARPTGSTLSTASVAAGVSGLRPQPSPTTNSPSPTGGPSHHEVLQNFFQSLLSSKDRAGASAAAQTRSSPPKTNGSEEGTS